MDSNQNLRRLLRVTDRISRSAHYLRASLCYRPVCSLWYLFQLRFAVKWQVVTYAVIPAFLVQLRFLNLGYVTRSNFTVYEFHLFFYFKLWRAHVRTAPRQLRHQPVPLLRPALPFQRCRWLPCFRRTPETCAL